MAEDGGSGGGGADDGGDGTPVTTMVGSGDGKRWWEAMAVLTTKLAMTQAPIPNHGPAHRERRCPESDG
jgi:hypothetical protein